MDDKMAGETDSEDEAEKPLSKKEQRKLNRLTELKQLVPKPEMDR